MPIRVRCSPKSDGAFFRTEAQKPKNRLQPPTATATSQSASALAAKRDAFTLPFLSRRMISDSMSKKLAPASFEGQAAGRRNNRRHTPPPHALRLSLFFFFAGRGAAWKVACGMWHPLQKPSTRGWKVGQASLERRNHRSGMQQIFEFPLFYVSEALPESSAASSAVKRIMAKVNHRESKWKYNLMLKKSFKLINLSY